MSSGNAVALPRPKFSGRPFPVSFTDVAAASGLNMRFVQGSALRKKYIIESTGTGVAFVDYDNDGRLDIFLVNSAPLAAAPGPRPTSHLYRNLGGGKFADVSAKAGVARPGWGNGVCGGDFDNDGHDDLYVTYRGPNSLYRNRGDGTFEDAAARAGAAGPESEWSTGCTFLDYDRDGRLDLFVASYVGFDIKTAPLPGQHPFCRWAGLAVFCGPRGLRHGTSRLLRNLGGGTFEDRTAASGIGNVQGFYAFTAMAADFNGDGWTDIYVAADSTPSLYWRNNRDGTFREIGTEAGLAFNEHGAEQAGMGVAAGDYDNDGWLDITKTNFIREYPNLYRNLGRGVFDDVAMRAGLAVNPDHVLWGAGFEDLDNDGWRDHIQVSGHVYPELEAAGKPEPYRGPRLVYRNLGGKFEDVSSIAGPGVASKHSSRGAAFGDFDNDGDIDVLVMNMDEPPSLLRNDSKSPHGWIKLLLEGSRSNRGAAGAMVTVISGAEKQTAAVQSQSSYLSVNDRRLHFGLGAAESVDKITVIWPSGAAEEFPRAEAGRLYRLVEGSGKAEPLEMPR
jgi:hypothetical protein